MGMEARVKAGIWVSMATRLSDIAGRPAAVIRKGDPDSGGVLCVLRGRQGHEGLRCAGVCVTWSESA